MDLVDSLTTVTQNLEQIADMYEKVTEVLKRQYKYFENVNLFYNGNWLSIRSIV